MKIHRTRVRTRIACFGVSVVALFGICAINAMAAPKATLIADNVLRVKVAGIDLVVYPTAAKDVVAILGSLPAGDAFAPQGNAAIPTLTGMMLDRGTTTEDQFVIASQLEEVGAAIGFSVNTQAVSVQAHCLSKSLPLVIRLIAEQLRAPAFNPTEFDKARQQFIGSIKNALVDTDFRAQDAFTRAVYPEGHPNRLPRIEDLVAAAERATLDDLKRFHRKYYGPAHMTLVVVGDIDVKRLKSEVKKGFVGWAGGSDVMRPAKSASAGAPRIERISIAEKTSVSVTLGQATGLRYRDPDALALRVGTAILGSGFTGRLMNSVRDKEGLTYAIGASVSDDTFTDGHWSISASFAPQLVDNGIASAQRELMQWWSGGVTEQELASRKQNLIGTYQVSLATTRGLARAFLTTIQRGYEVSWLDNYPAAINALTLAQVNRAIHEHIDPTKLVLVEAGTLPSS
jgi:zinc protease